MDAASRSDARRHGPEIVGVGALNVDYIASVSRLSAHMADRVSESTARFEWNTEGPIDEIAISKAIGRLGAASLDASLGGSAWLTTFTLAQMRLGLTLGYVGVAGRIETPGLSFVRQMDLFGIDRRWVARRPQRLAGVCLSYLEDVERVMLTHPGANYLMAEHLTRNGEQIAHYLAQARIVHVTSFLDELTPPVLLEVLCRARRINPALLLSFDPGFAWAENRSGAVDGILALSDLLFVNHREFKALGEYALGESDEVLSQRVLARCGPSCTVFVTKRYDSVEVFRTAPTGVLAQRFQLRRPVREGAIEDATGAGDVFSASVIAALASTRLQAELGSFLGLSLSRLRAVQAHTGTSALPVLGREGFLQSTEALTAPGTRPGAVLVAHDEDAQWDALRTFLEDDCRLTVHTLNHPRGQDARHPQVMREQLGRCAFAICVLSASRVMAAGQRRASESAVHQVGVFQGYYGFGKVAILAEEGCEEFSNNAGLIRLDFAPGRIGATFVELERMLVRERILARGGHPHDR
ncbi:MULTISPECIES: carbohydrate kinase family protein [unclassified Streptomyces]|uniref:carbohydrate kinase family protein n=1 Tax=unclassified Streptomyces TaxID=2593676 RepID=UPI000DC755F7|nr:MULTISPECIES: carbohydrate kinase family protein [unclassified Streptomyces]AWZ08176.1 carbohydrate kinase family protein [Streptomyces sp. ICC4]AWZ17090.1 carbohydrate kinase family protein [Streptomyces sp. ICC1]